jgi:hypothetical protein
MKRHGFFLNYFCSIALVDFIRFDGIRSIAEVLFKSGRLRSESSAQTKHPSIHSGVDFINILHSQFSYQFLAPKISTRNTAFVQNFGDKNALSYKKRACKKLMKLTVGFKLCISYCQYNIFQLFLNQYVRVAT